MTCRSRTARGPLGSRNFEKCMHRERSSLRQAVDKCGNLPCHSTFDKEGDLVVGRQAACCEVGGSYYRAFPIDHNHLRMKKLISGPGKIRDGQVWISSPEYCESSLDGFGLMPQ